MRRLVITAVALGLVSIAAAAVSPDVDRALRDSKYVYVQSQRKSGQFGKPAEIWFHWDGKVLWVGTPPTTYRVRRIKAGRPKAHIAVGKSGGPAFDATGEVVKDTTVEKSLMEDYAHKYPEGWARFADKFRDGFRTGERVLVRYTPK